MPQMQFSTLVLPAPFGPISASSSPACAANEMPSSTFSPPKARCSARSSSSAITASRAAVLLHFAIAAARRGTAEIKLDHVGVRAQPLRRAVEDDAAVLHHIAIVRHIEREAGVLLDEDDGHGQLAADGLQTFHQLLDEQRREPLRELIDEQELRRAHERAADREHLALAAGKQSRLAAAQFGEPREELVDALNGLASLAASSVRRLQVFGDREVLEYLAAFRDEHDAARGNAVRRLVLDAFALVLDGTFRDLGVVEADEAGDRAQGGGLAGAIRAEDGDERAARHLEGDALLG